MTLLTIDNMLLCLIAYDYMWKVSSKQLGIPLMYYRDPALPGQNFPI